MKRYCTLLILLTVLITGMKAQSAEKRLEHLRQGSNTTATAGKSQTPSQALKALGIENITIATYGDTVYAIIEPTPYRGTFRGAGAALKALAESNPTACKFEIVVQEYHTDRVAIHAQLLDSNEWDVNADYDSRDVRNKIQFATARGFSQVKEQNTSSGKLDMTFYPMVTFDNHRFDRLGDYGIFIAPSIETTLWHGNRITLQPIVPIWTNFDKHNTDRNLHLGVMSIQQELLNNARWNATLAAGTFLYDRLGGNLNVGYHMTPYIDLGLQANLSVRSVFEDWKWHIGKSLKLSTLLKASWYEPRSSMQVQLTAGRFIYGDWGARLDATRHFGEYAIGLYATLTGGEHNAGFHFAIPFGGKRQKRNTAVRVLLPEYFDWEYSMVSWGKYADDKMGQMLETRPDENRSAHYWQAKYIQRYLQKYLDGTFK